MKTIIRTIPVYQFSELNETAHNKAVDNEINFYIEAVDYDHMSEDMKRAVDKAEHMLTPWFTGEYIWDYCQEEILGGLNECEFLINGDLYTSELSDVESIKESLK